jgi:hypothetical protein
MKLEEHLLFDLPPERVWPWVADPDLVRYSNFHLPLISLWARLLMALVFRFGTPKGESDLEALRRVMREGGEERVRR